MDTEIVHDTEIAAGAAIVGVVEVVAAPVDAIAPVVDKVVLDVKSVCDEAIAPLKAIYDKIADHPDAKGLRSTLNHAIGRFEAEKQQLLWK